ncbi:MAG: Cytidylate kinase, partial [Actinomycetota bacterium]
DSSREVSPLRVPEDAIVIDATHLTVDQVIEQMLHHIARVS